ncbi:MAG: ammonium transporter, partial [Gammaproteobacteria bacterium]|nr:ammonium transporter [Gammaproteobacteria bacterium]
ALGIFSGQQDIAIGTQVGIQAVGVFATVAYTAIATFIILKIVDVVTGNRVTEDQETEGLDLVMHNERGYDL